MFCDLLLMERSLDIESFSQILGFNKVYFKDEISKLGIKEAKDYSEARALVENNRIKLLLNPHTFGKKDNYSYDRLGLDHILCEVANKNGIFIGFSLDKIKTSTEMNWVIQSIKLCRKYKVKLFFFSFATNKYEMVARIDFISLLKVLGMKGKEAKTALSLC